MQRGAASLQIPAGTTARVGIPKIGRTVQCIRLEGQLVWDGRYHSAANIRGASEDADFVWLEGLRQGDYTFSIRYTGSAESYRDGPFVYPARFVKEDTRTGGNWGGAYGRDGSVLFSYDGPGKDRVRLPDYVTSVVCRRGNGRQWAPSTDDPRVPARDAANSSARTAAALFTGDPAPCQQSIVLDVALKTPREYQFALYFVDFDHKGRREAVELFDLESRKLIAPVKVFRNLDGGTYAVYACRQPVRVRVNQLRGENAVLSGLFFDP
jgi:hypothetical protein